MESIIYNGKYWISETSPDLLKSLLERGIINSNFKILNFVEEFFQPFGYTALWLLGESHIAVHTFPENDCTYIEVSSCVEGCFIKLQEFLENEIGSLENIPDKNKIFLNHDYSVSKP